MKKKFLSLLLAALMVIPFAALASVGASAATVPVEPVATANIALFVSYQKTSGVQSSAANSGTSADQPLDTFGNLFPLITITGGKIVFPGKGYVGMDYTFPKCEAPVTITSYDPNLNTRYDGTIEVEDQSNPGKYNNGSQIGMLMIYADKTLTIGGDYIFENTTILERDQTGTSRIRVASGANLVIKEDVKIVKMTNAPENVLMNVDAGGTLFLHAVGFEKYTGTGTIVVDKKLLDAGTASVATFAGFEGYVIDTEGNVLMGTEPVVTPDTEEETTVDSEEATETKKENSTTKADSTTKTESTTKAGSTTKADADTVDEETDITHVIIIVAAVAAAIVIVVVVVIIVKKKKAE